MIDELIRLLQMGAKPITCYTGSIVYILVGKEGTNVWLDENTED